MKFMSSLRRVISTIYANAIIRPEFLVHWCPNKGGWGGGQCNYMLNSELNLNVCYLKTVCAVEMFTLR